MVQFKYYIQSKAIWGLEVHFHHKESLNVKGEFFLLVVQQVNVEKQNEWLSYDHTTWRIK